MSLYDPVGSHAPILAALAAMTRGTIVEMGCGFYSTPLFNLICCAQGRNLITFETDGEWLKRFEPLRSDSHGLFHIQDWDKVIADLGQVKGADRIGLAFVDCKPGEKRADIIRGLRGIAGVVAVHDTETDHATGANYQYGPAFAEYSYYRTFKWMRPYTTVLVDDLTNAAILKKLIVAWPGKWTPPPDCPCADCRRMCRV